jgi:hypothetical protein
MMILFGRRKAAPGAAVRRDGLAATYGVDPGPAMAVSFDAMIEKLFHEQTARVP